MPFRLFLSIKYRIFTVSSSNKELLITTKIIIMEASNKIVALENGRTVILSYTRTKRGIRYHYRGMFGRMLPISKKRFAIKNTETLDFIERCRENDLEPTFRSIISQAGVEDTARKLAKSNKLNYVDVLNYILTL